MAALLGSCFVPLISAKGQTSVPSEVTIGYPYRFTNGVDGTLAATGGANLVNYETCTNLIFLHGGGENDPIYTNDLANGVIATGTPVYVEWDPHFSGVSNSIVYDGDAAGGDLEGTYPSPSIATGAVHVDHLGTTNPAAPGLVLGSGATTQLCWVAAGAKTNEENHWILKQYFDGGIYTTNGVEVARGAPLWIGNMVGGSNRLWNEYGSGLKWGTSRVWREANDGSGSGLDADLIDGLDSSALVKHGDAAGGDLSGTYPDPTIAAGAVGSNQINWSETTLGSVGDVVITAGMAAGQSLKYDGTNWYAGTDETGGGGGAATNQHGLSVSGVSGTWTIDYDAGSYQRANITGAVTNVTVTGAAAAEFAELTLVVANPSVYSILWPTSNWYWMEGTAPESTTNGWDIYSLWTYSNVTWIGRAGGSDQ